MLHLDFSQTHKIGNIIANFVFRYICSFLNAFAICDVYKYEMRYHWILWDCISRLQISLVQFLFNGAANEVVNIGNLVLWRVCEKTLLILRGYAIKAYINPTNGESLDRSHLIITFHLILRH